jgi:hypothetical protein
MNIDNTSKIINIETTITGVIITYQTNNNNIIKHQLDIGDMVEDPEFLISIFTKG